MLSNISITASHTPFGYPQAPNPASSLQLVLYLCVSLSVASAFLGLQID